MKKSIIIIIAIIAALAIGITVAAVAISNSGRQPEPATTTQGDNAEPATTTNDSGDPGSEPATGTDKGEPATEPTTDPGTEPATGTAGGDEQPVTQKPGDGTNVEPGTEPAIDPPATDAPGTEEPGTGEQPGIETQPGHKHVYAKASEKAATCTETGSVTYKCNECGASYTETTKALGHSFSAWKTTKATTCTAHGEQARSCSRCGLEETQYPSPLGHSYSVLVRKIEATELEGGYSVYKCSRCELTEMRDFVEPISSGEHEHNYVRHQRIAPTTTEPGYDIFMCTICGATYNKVYAEALGDHKPTDYIPGWEPKNPPTDRNVDGHTCNYEFNRTIMDQRCGHYYYIYVCSICGDTWKTAFQTYKYCDFEFLETIEPTYLTTGVTRWKCKNCGYIMETDFKPTLTYTHDFGWVEVDSWGTADSRHDRIVKYSCGYENCPEHPNYKYKAFNEFGQEMRLFVMQEHYTDKRYTWNYAGTVEATFDAHVVDERFGYEDLDENWEKIVSATWDAANKTWVIYWIGLDGKTYTFPWKDGDSGKDTLATLRLRADNSLLWTFTSGGSKVPDTKPKVL